MALTGTPLDLNLTLIQTTINTKPTGKLRTVQEYRNYYEAGQLARRMKVDVTGGTQYTDRISLLPDGTADRILPDEALSYGADDNLFTMNLPYRVYRTKYVLDDFEMDAARAGGNANQVVKLIDVKREPSIRAAARTIVDDMWGAPLSVTDTRRAWGFKYWLSKANTGVAAGVRGFNGQTIRFGSETAPTSTSTVKGGIDGAAAGTNGLWRNWTSVIADATNLQVWAEELTRMMLELGFTPPDDLKSITDNTGEDDFGIFVGIAFYTRLVTACRAGGGVYGLRMDDAGNLYFQNVRIRSTNPLDNDPHSATYVINFKFWEMIVPQGWWGKDAIPLRDKDYPTKVWNNTFWHFNARCVNVRQGGGVIHTPIV